MRIAVSGLRLRSLRSLRAVSGLRLRSLRSLRAVSAVALAMCCSCTTYHDQLGRSERAFEVSENDRTLAGLRDLEPDVEHLTAPEQAEYAYIRGMTDYRLGYRPDARHWLAMAKAYEDHSPGLLPAEWKKGMTDALTELNNVVYADGTAGLTSSRTTTPSTPPPAKAKED